MSEAAHLLVVQCSMTLENLATLFQPVGPHYFNEHKLLMVEEFGVMLVEGLTYLCPLCFVGLHADHVLPTVLEGQAPGLPGDPAQPDLG